jgi:hypothetical protein
LQQVVAKWQLGGIMNFNTGAPLSLTTGTAIQSTTSGVQTLSNVSAQPNIVGSLPKDLGQITKLPGSVVYFNGYTQATDPGFASVSPTCAASTAACNGLVSGYNNKAIVDPNGNTVLVNPQPGQLGTLGYGSLKGPRSLSFDMNMVKRFNITETKSFEFRVDAINILNHPNFSNPTTNINGVGTFGRITTTNGSSRRFVLNTRINF